MPFPFWSVPEATATGTAFRIFRLRTAAMRFPKTPRNSSLEGDSQEMSGTTASMDSSTERVSTGTRQGVASVSAKSFT